MTPQSGRCTRGTWRSGWPVVVQEAASDVPITVAEMVLLGRSPHRSAFQRYSGEDHRIAAQALQRVGARHLADRTFAALSGGERQRVLIARTLAQQTDHLLLDEPTTTWTSATSTRSSSCSGPWTSRP